MILIENFNKCFRFNDCDKKVILDKHSNSCNNSYYYEWYYNNDAKGTSSNSKIN